MGMFTSLDWEHHYLMVTILFDGDSRPTSWLLDHAPQVEFMEQIIERTQRHFCIYSVVRLTVDSFETLREHWPPTRIIEGDES